MCHGFAVDHVALAISPRHRRAGGGFATRTPSSDGRVSRASPPEATGDTDRALTTLLDARARASRLADPYVWLEAYILDAWCDLSRRHAHPETRAWIENMSDLTSRTGMRELTVRAMVHSAALGNPGDASAAALLAADIENPVLHGLLQAVALP